LGVILAKLEKLEDASKHPDLGPVGDGLITLMDQKLSKLDDRLYELSSRLATANVSSPEIKTEPIVETSSRSTQTQPEQKTQTKKSFIFDKPKPERTEPVVIPPTKSRQSFELTTLTNISKREPKFPLFETKIPEKQEIVQEVVSPKNKIQEKIETIQPVTEEKPVTIFETKPDLTKEVEKITQFKALPEPPKEIRQPPKEKPQSSFNLDEEFDDDSDDIDKIKGEIMSVLSKLDQAEVE
jgi:hypothetical protein